MSGPFQHLITWTRFFDICRKTRSQSKLAAYYFCPQKPHLKSIGFFLPQFRHISSVTFPSPYLSFISETTFFGFMCRHLFLLDAMLTRSTWCLSCTLQALIGLRGALCWKRGRTFWFCFTELRFAWNRIDRLHHYNHERYPLEFLASNFRHRWRKYFISRDWSKPETAHEKSLAPTVWPNVQARK